MQKMTLKKLSLSAGLVVSCLPLLSASGCSSLAVQSVDSAASETVFASTSLPVNNSVTATRRLNADQIYRVLAAESLYKQGDVYSAAKLYLDLAQYYQDAELAQRAFELSIISRQKDVLVEATRLNALLNSSTDAQKLDVYVALLIEDISSATAAWLLLYDQLIEQGIEEKYIYFSIADLARESVDFGVLRAFSEQVAVAKPSPYAEFILIMLMAEAGEVDAAGVRLQSAVKAYPDQLELAQLMIALTRQESSAQNLDWLADYVARHPQHRGVAEQLAKLYVSLGNVEAARIVYERLLKQKYSDRLALSLAIIALEQEDSVVAEQYLLGIQAPDAFTDLIAYYLGQAYVLQERHEAALEKWRSINGDDYRLDALVWQVQTLVNLKRITEAHALLAQFDVRDDQEYIKVAKTKAHLYAYEENYAQAIVVLDEAIELYAQNADFWHQRANMKYLIDDEQGFEADVRQAYTLSPDEADILNSLGYYLADKGKSLAEARELLEKANDLLPNKHYIIDSLGWLAYQEGDYAQALALLEQAYDIKADPEILRHRLLALLALKREGDAKVLVQQEAGQFDNADLDDFLKQMLLTP